ncbi:hypothetical protein BT93_H2347 [Corymbia citriodora subsp. variegata]|nr:hypothetical protein BT93_H2347 [Corymbia citriodora subsp. variegata]
MNAVDTHTSGARRSPFPLRFLESSRFHVSSRAADMMEVSDGHSPARAVNDRIYVAVGRDVQESKSTLRWALDNFGGDFRIVHVHQPHQLNPSPHLFYGSGSRNPQELAMQEMDCILDAYIHMCDLAEVHAEKRFVEMQDIGKGIVELIEQHAITKLVMGAAADRRYFEGMTQLTSVKAKFVNQHAPPSCRIWFVCNGRLIYLREGNLDTFDMDIASSGSQSSSVVESGLQNVRSPLHSVHSRSNDSDNAIYDLTFVRNGRGEGSSSISESNSVRAYEGGSQNQSYTGMLRALENMFNEQLRVRKDLEESLAIEQEAFKALKNRHDELQLLFDDALEANYELLANQTSEPPSAHGQDFISEYSWHELHEATDSFNQSLRIEEGLHGSTYKGSLHHMPVVIKKMPPCDYRQQVQLAAKSRHPNLVTLIGVSTDTPALIYEYLPNGSLEDQLCARDTGNHLPWQTRIRICADICAALMFLHSCHEIVHGDLKPGNILLDSNFAAKITNFGLHSAPYGSSSTGELSFASDVYAFGNVLLRLLTGRSALNLDEMVQSTLDVGNLRAVLDPTAGDWPLEQATELARLALSCRDIDSDNRPDLVSQVWPVLEAFLSSLSRPEDPGEPPDHFLCPISYVRTHARSSCGGRWLYL